VHTRCITPADQFQFVSLYSNLMPQEKKLALEQWRLEARCREALAREELKREGLRRKAQQTEQQAAAKSDQRVALEAARARLAQLRVARHQAQRQQALKQAAAGPLGQLQWATDCSPGELFTSTKVAIADSGRAVSCRVIAEPEFAVSWPEVTEPVAVPA
jgi:hypothetical protein